MLRVATLVRWYKKSGTLEHALESARVRPFFAHWADSAVLNRAWQLAMEWAVYHGDPTN